MSNLGSVLIRAVKAYLNGEQLKMSAYAQPGDESYENLMKPGYAGAPPNAAGSLSGTLFGDQLTGAEIQANQFNANEAALAFRREIYADSTKHQREVADLQAAGLNPMLSAGLSGGSVHSSPAASVAPGLPGVNLGQVMSFVLGEQQLKLEKRKAEADIRNKDADTENKLADTESKRLYNDFFRDTQNIRKILLGDEHDRNLWERNIGERGVAVKEAAQALAEKNAEHYNAWLDEQKGLISEQKITEDFKRISLAANAREADASAAYKNAMREVDRQYREVATESEREQKELLSIEARIKNGVFNKEYIEDMRKICHNQALVAELERQYKSGDYSGASKSLQKVFREIEKQTKDGNWSYGSMYFHGSGSPAATPPALD